MLGLQLTDGKYKTKATPRKIEKWIGKPFKSWSAVEAEYKTTQPMTERSIDNLRYKWVSIVLPPLRRILRGLINAGNAKIRFKLLNDLLLSDIEPKFTDAEEWIRLENYSRLPIIWVI